MKMFARTVLNSSYENGVLTYNNKQYDASLTIGVENLVNSCKVDLAKLNNLILVPHTLPENNDNIIKDKNSEEQTPYLRFTVIGVEKNQPNLVLDEVNILGKVIYENIQHRFILVKIKRGDKYEILKLNGTLDESIKQGKGSAVESRYEIKAIIKGNSLIIISSKCVEITNNIIQFPVYRQEYNKAA
jgi:hypothetical protein